MSLRERYGIGVHTFPFAARAIVTFPFVVWTTFLVVELFRQIMSDDPRPAALYLVVLAPTLGLGLPFFKALWRPTHEAIAIDRQTGRDVDTVAEQLTWQPPRRDFPVGRYDDKPTSAVDPSARTFDGQDAPSPRPAPPVFPISRGSTR